MSTTLKNRRALVTGASSGIGFATAQALREAGARVATGARRTDRLAGDLRLALDVADESSVRAAVAETVAEFGGLDLVVNAAGTMPLGPVLGADVRIWRRTIDTNLLGLMLVTHAALPHLVEAASGNAPANLINISSVGGREAFPNASLYNATKFAVLGFSEALRKEMAPAGVRVSVVEPGYTDTDLLVGAGITSQPTIAAADVADSIVHIAGRPAHVVVNSLQIRPVSQP